MLYFEWDPRGFVLATIYDSARQTFLGEGLPGAELQRVLTTAPIHYQNVTLETLPATDQPGYVTLVVTVAREWRMELVDDDLLPLALPAPGNTVPDKLHPKANFRCTWVGADEPGEDERDQLRYFLGTTRHALRSQSAVGRTARLTGSGWHVAFCDWLVQHMINRH